MDLHSSPGALRNTSMAYDTRCGSVCVEHIPGRSELGRINDAESVAGAPSYLLTMQIHNVGIQKDSRLT